MAQIQAVMSSSDKAEATRMVAEVNARVNQGKVHQQDLGKDDFLKLLITQLANQDPTEPVQDKEFIAQMAQFSSLEQMTNMAQDFAKMSVVLKSSEAANVIGKDVEIVDGNRTVTGQVNAVTRAITAGDTPQVQVNGEYFNWDKVTKVYDSAARSAGQVKE
jgi:flagellar basal-body rod modification protein FlgD